jgi:hypothetical protein
MAVQVSLVPYGNICRAIPTLVPCLEKSELWTKGRACIDDIIRFILTGQMQLWFVFDPDAPDKYAYLATEIKQYPQSKMLVVQYCAGDTGTLATSRDICFEMLEKFAKSMSCLGIEFFGRPGWTPHAKKHGYTNKTVVYEKYFNEV